MSHALVFIQGYAVRAQALSLTVATPSCCTKGRSSVRYTSCELGLGVLASASTALPNACTHHHQQRGAAHTLQNTHFFAATMPTHRDVFFARRGAMQARLCNQVGMQYHPGHNAVARPYRALQHVIHDGLVPG